MTSRGSLATTLILIGLLSATGFAQGLEQPSAGQSLFDRNGQDDLPRLDLFAAYPMGRDEEGGVESCYTYDPDFYGDLYEDAPAPAPPPERPRFDRTVDARVLGLERLRAGDGRPESMRLHVRTAEGSTRTVHLGDLAYVQENLERPRPGEPIEVAGDVFTRDGRRYFKARVIRAQGSDYEIPDYHFDQHIVGRLQNLREVMLDHGEVPGVVAEIETQDGQAMDVLLGALQDLRRSRLALRPNERITVEGWSRTADGQRTFFIQDVKVRGESMRALAQERPHEREREWEAWGDWEGRRDLEDWGELQDKEAGERRQPLMAERERDIEPEPPHSAEKEAPGTIYLYRLDLEPAEPRTQDAPDHELTPQDEQPAPDAEPMRQHLQAMEQMQREMRQHIQDMREMQQAMQAQMREMQEMRQQMQQQPRQAAPPRQPEQPEQGEQSEQAAPHRQSRQATQEPSRQIQAQPSPQQPVDWPRAAKQVVELMMQEQSHQTPRPQRPVEEELARWPEAGRQAAELLIQKHGPPDQVGPYELIWTRNVDPFAMIGVLGSAQSDGNLMSHAVHLRVPDQRVQAIEQADLVRLVPEQGLVVAYGPSEAMNILALNLAHDIIAGQRTAGQAQKLYKDMAAKLNQGEAPEIARRLQFQVPRRHRGQALQE